MICAGVSRREPSLTSAQFQIQNTSILCLAPIWTGPQKWKMIELFNSIQNIFETMERVLSFRTKKQCRISKSWHNYWKRVVFWGKQLLETPILGAYKQRLLANLFWKCTFVAYKGNLLSIFLLKKCVLKKSYSALPNVAPKVLHRVYYKICTFFENFPKKLHQSGAYRSPHQNCLFLLSGAYKGRCRII